MSVTGSEAAVLRGVGVQVFTESMWKSATFGLLAQPTARRLMSMKDGTDCLGVAPSEMNPMSCSIM